MLTAIGFLLLHILLLTVICFLTVKAAPNAKPGQQVKLFLGIALSTVPPVGWLQWGLARNRAPAYAESCMLQSLAGIGYIVLGSYGLGLI